MGIKKLDVKVQQLCSDSVRGDIKESLCGLIGAELQPAEESPAHSSGWGCVHLNQAKPAGQRDPQTPRNFPVTEQNKNRTYLCGLVQLAECFCRVNVSETPRHVLELRVELSHLAELSTHLPDCNNYRFQGHIH